MKENRKLAAILAADVVGFSRLTGVDEDRTLARLRALRSDLVDPTIAVHNGRVVKRTGDGAIVEFRSVVDAVRCAIEIQNAMVERNAGVPEERRIEFRIGVHLGDVVEESDGDLMGDGVNIAARLEGVAQPGSICLSEDAYRQVKSRLDLKVSDLGATALKNIAEPMRVYSLRVGPPVRQKPTGPSDVKFASMPGPAASLDKPSIAVLPFANMSGDAEQEYFADGISEDIITALSKLPPLFVIARNSSFTFKGKNVHIAEVGKSLGVRYVLEGSVRKAGDRVRITAQLIDSTTGGHLWAERFDRQLTDIFAVQDDVADHIVSALALNLSPGERTNSAAVHTDNPEAYDCFLRGREVWYLYTKESDLESERLLQRAVELDPLFVPAIAFLAAAQARVSLWADTQGAGLERAMKTARQAMRLDERNSLALWAFAMICAFTRRYDEAGSAGEKGVAVNPNYAEAHTVLGVTRLYTGHFEDAIACFERAMALDPYFPGLWLYFKAQAVYQLGRYSEAVALLKRRIQRNPETDLARVLLAACYGQMGLVDEAQEAWRELMRVNPGYSLGKNQIETPYKNPADFERIVEGLRKAGLPEKI
jgi:adenylate cyclase